VTAVRDQGWAPVVALALVTLSLGIVDPPLLIFVPLALVVVALPPRRPVMLAFAMFVIWLAFQAGPATGALWNFGRGWALVLGAWFVMILALTPSWSFLSRAITAVVGTAATMCVLIAVNRGGLSGLDVEFGQRLTAGLQWMSSRLGENTSTEEYNRISGLIIQAWTDVYPALLGLESVAALGLTWWAYNRLAASEKPAFAPWVELRFRDELIWLLIAGLVVILAPVDPLTHRAGLNVLVFMVGLYAARGAAVLSMLGGAPGPLGYLLGAVLVLLMFPFVIATTLLVGLSDTWLDLRARRAASQSPGS
jgi:hypothetical protein